ncbi:hypothetical protein RFI_14368, partial [Reticulomyxa filosa]
GTLKISEMKTLTNKATINQESPDRYEGLQWTKDAASYFNESQTWLTGSTDNINELELYHAQSERTKEKEKDKDKNKENEKEKESGQFIKKLGQPHASSRLEIKKLLTPVQRESPLDEDSELSRFPHKYEHSQSTYSMSLPELPGDHQQDPTSCPFLLLLLLFVSFFLSFLVHFSNKSRMDSISIM